MSTDANTIHLTDDRFAELTRAAQAEGKTPDEVADEAIAMLLGKRRLDELMEFGQRHTSELGIPESDVNRLISEVRAERQRDRWPCALPRIPTSTSARSTMGVRPVRF